MAGQIICDRGGLGVRTPYDPSLLPVLRALPGARWDRDARVWRVSTGATDIPLILETAKAHGWAVTAEAEAAIRQALPSPAEIVVDDRLYPFQRTGARWLASRVRALLADQMGTGKTAQALCALPGARPVVVVCPATVKGVWRREIGSWRPDYRAEVLSGRDGFRWPEKGEIVIVNYDILPAAPPSGAPEGLALIIDEAHYAKNRKAKRTKAVRKLAAVAATVWGLTGTPMLNRPPELWSVLETLVLAEEAFGHFGRFCKAFNGYRGRYGYEWGSPKPEVPGLLRRVSLRRTREEVLPDLPVKTRRQVPVNNLPAGLRARLDEALAQWYAEGRIEGNEIPKYLPPFEGMSELRADLAAAKIPALLSLVEDYEEQEEPVVVFSAHRAPVDALAAREGWGVITGDEANETRNETVARFQRGELKGLALTIGAGREGITLTRAHQMVFVDLMWTPALNQQAEDRICRIGQDRGCLYTILTAEHPMDQHVNDLLIEKAALLEASTDAATRGAVIEDPEELLAALRSNGAPAPEPARLDLSDVLAKIPDSRYATVGENGQPDFWVIDSGSPGGKWEGFRFVRQQRGPELARFATIRPDGTTGNTAAAAILRKIAENPAEACARYGREIGECGICGLPLTNDESRKLGIGPICAAKRGW